MMKKVVKVIFLTVVTFTMIGTSEGCAQEVIEQIIAHGFAGAIDQHAFTLLSLALIAISSAYCAYVIGGKIVDTFRKSGE